MAQSENHHSFVQIWRWPTLIATLVVFGLLAALIGHDGAWLALSWIALSVPFMIIAVSIFVSCLRRS
jgi:hypothetical protein